MAPDVTVLSITKETNVTHAQRGLVGTTARNVLTDSQAQNVQNALRDLQGTTV